MSKPQIPNLLLCMLKHYRKPSEKKLLDGFKEIIGDMGRGGEVILWIINQNISVFLEG